MKLSNGWIALFVLAFVTLGCSALRDLAKKDNSRPAANSTNTSGANSTATNTASTNTSTDSNATKSKPTVEKADFEYSAEELDKIYTKKGVSDKDLEKFANKNIAVSGRVSTLVLDKRGTVQPWVTLYAPGTLHGVSCYFDDENVDQMKDLKMDKMAKVQGFQDDFIVPEISPRLEHCVVLEAN